MLVQAINTALTHDVADQQVLVPMGKVFKQFDEWEVQSGFWQQMDIGIKRAWAFRQGGDEFGMVTECVAGDAGRGDTVQGILRSHQKLHELIKSQINAIKIKGHVQCVDPSRNNFVMEHVTLSTGVSTTGVTKGGYKDWLLFADKMAEEVKESGKDGLKVFAQDTSGRYQRYDSFLEIRPMISKA